MTEFKGHAARTRGIRRRCARTVSVMAGILGFAFALSAQSPPSNVSVSPSSGSGASQTFSFTSSSPGGYSHVLWMEMLVNSGNVAQNGCFMAFWPGSNTVGLAGDDGSTWPMTGVLGSATPLQNRQCRVNLASSTVSVSGNNVTVNVALTFLGTFIGSKQTWIQTGDVNGLAANWQQFGTWTTVSAQPSALVSVTPSYGTGMSQTFTYVASNLNGNNAITGLHTVIGNAVSDAGTCYIYLDRTYSVFGLVSDTGWAGGAQTATLGATATLSNSQCQLNVASSTVTGSGNTLTVSLAITFKPAFVGARNSYMLDSDPSGYVGWQQMGTWSVASAPQAPSNVLVSPSSGTGVSQKFTFTSSSPGGYPDIAWMQMIFNYAVDGAGACYFYYSPGSNTISLANDTGSGYVASAVIGTAGTIENSQCRLDAGTSTVGKSFNTIALGLSLTFKAGMPGPQNIYLDTAGNSGLSSGWQQVGTWTTTTVSSQPPSLVSVTPASGAGMSRTFSYVASSVNGGNYIMQLHTIIGNAISDAGNCYVYLDRPGNYIQLLSDTGWAGGAQYGNPGAPGTLSNSQCQVDTGASSVVVSGNNVTLNLAVTFKPAWTGVKNTYLYAWDRGTAAGWGQMGTWTVGSTPALSITKTHSGNFAKGGTSTYTVTASNAAGSGLTNGAVTVTEAVPAGMTLVACS